MDQRDPAEARFWTLQALRVSGAVITFLGAMVLVGRLDWPQPLGVLLFVAGAVEFFALPHVLAKHWKSEE